MRVQFHLVDRRLDARIAQQQPQLGDRHVEEMREIAGIDRNCRLIKGQVFLWRQEQTWEDLWDLDGVIKT